jgi:hypothetical protein
MNPENTQTASPQDNDRLPFLVGTYALGSFPSTYEANEALAAKGVTGLEVPITSESASVLAKRLEQDTPRDWVFLGTMIPKVMSSLANNKDYGLASNNELGRRQAIDDVHVLYEVARNLSSMSGFPRMIGIEVHSAPGPVLGSEVALKKSLEELLSDLPMGTTLFLEHCDAYSPNLKCAKGFFPLDTELSVLNDLHEADPLKLIGVSINWGRSAIEGRSPDTPLKHAHLAAASGLSVCAVLSGATDATGKWGQPWEDSHIPLRLEGVTFEETSASLLSQDRVQEFIVAANPSMLALKISNKIDDSASTSKAILNSAIDLIQDIQGGQPE